MKMLAGAVLTVGLLSGASPVTGALNSAANAIFQAVDAPNRMPTKVVPLLTQAGERAGFAQIAGDSKALAHAAAVVQIRAGAPWHITAFIPVWRFAPGQAAFTREYGVYVTAIAAVP